MAMVGAESLPDLTSLVDLLAYRAREQPNDRAYVFLSERGGEEAVLTFAELERRAGLVAARLAARLRAGDRALLVFPAGLDFMVAFFGCLKGGVIAVPMMVPRRASSHDSSTAILADCRPPLAMTTADLAAVRPDVIQRYRDAGLDWLLLEADDAAASPPSPAVPPRGRNDIAFLQYTSGSTSSPKGVVVTHGNLIENLEMIRRAWASTRASTIVSWVPLYHDMGLILNALHSLYVGALCVLMPPVSFIRRPLAWLQAIHAYQAELSTAPNFAFDMCVSRFRAEQMEKIDLACWKVAINAAEPVRADTLARFAATFAPYGFDARAMHTAYGLAEATVMVSGGRREDGPVLRSISRSAIQHDQVAAPSGERDGSVVVGCGRSVSGERIAIVHPDTRRRLAPEKIGEVWVAGPNVAGGYWQNPETTAGVFQARIAGEDGEFWLRTGDVGFLDSDGELFITGRIKDVIIIRGMNHYPQDIENSMQDSHPALRRHCGAAFTIVDENGDERLILVQEVERAAAQQISIAEISGNIREAVFNDHEVAVHAVVLIRPGSIPKTTSGKIQRSLTRKLWQEGLLEALG
jgi:acyl-CoA synthetase (AMP-forming)/AMP-acid ligase II